MAALSFKENLEKLGIQTALSYLDRDPETNVPKLLDWIEKFDTKKQFTRQLTTVRAAVNDPSCAMYKLMMSFWTDVDPEVRKTLFTNFIVNGVFVGWEREEKMRAKYNCNIPWAILLDPTSACNMHCTGCWAAEYGNKLNISLDEIDSIINQGIELGNYFYIYTGGEPLVRKKDIITICERHPDCVFLSFTNSTLIDEDFAKEMLRVKNFVPAISIEGYEEATDSRRGKGTFQKVMKAMALLKQYKLPFGVSCCYTSHNFHDISSEAFFDSLISWGAKFAWFFTYMPIGCGAVTSLMATADQREYMYHKIRELRGTKPIFTMDFWNDGEYVGGCIAGGRRYLHINANGDYEPCVFIHYSNCNIRNATLLQALQSPIFMAYHDAQPFSDNLLRPCPVLDNSGALDTIVEKTGAVCTDLMEKEDVHDYTNKCRAVAAAWAPTADRLWKNDPHRHPLRDQERIAQEFPAKK